MQLAAPHQTPGNIGRLQRRALGPRMHREIIRVAAEGESRDSAIGRRGSPRLSEAPRARGDAREQWIAYSNKLAHPKYIPLFGVTIDNWWQKRP
jgi:hypothetical protein